MKILVLRFSSIGDIVLTTPLVRCIKNQAENVELHYATKAGYKDILSNNPYIDKLHLLKDDINVLIESLKEEKFDYVLDLHNNIRTQIIKLRLRVKTFSVNKLNFEKWLLTQFKINKLPKYTHIVDRYLYTAKTFGVKEDGLGLDYFISKEDEVNVPVIYPKIQTDYVAFAIGAKFYTKRLPYTKIIEICDALEMPIILLGGLDDLARGEEIVFKTKNLQVVNACGHQSLNQSASIVKQCSVLITNDTGLMHIGAAFKKPMVTVWGNTVPELGMTPYMPEENYKIIQAENLSCRPCSKIGYKKCPKGHFDCMQLLSVEEIVNAVHYYSSRA